MILPNKDVPFEMSLLYKSINILKSFEDKILIDELYANNSKLSVEDMNAILVFLYAINRIYIKENWVIKNDKKNL